MYFIKFLGIGAIATIIQYIIFIALVEFTSLAVVLSSALGYGISSIFNYLMNYHYTFSSEAKHKVASLKFTLVALIGLSLNSILMYLLLELFEVHYIVSQIIVTGVILVINFFAHKLWTFQTKIGNKHVG
jgi:putative flippase GtrA